MKSIIFVNKFVNKNLAIIVTEKKCYYRLVIAIFLSTNAYDDNHENTYYQSEILKSKISFIDSVRLFFIKENKSNFHRLVIFEPKKLVILNLINEFALFEHRFFMQFSG